MTDELKKQIQELSESVNHNQYIRLKCLEIAARMYGPLPGQAGETVQKYLGRYLPLSNVIEMHVTGQLSPQAQGGF